jgi:hypothetical protein
MAAFVQEHSGLACQSPRRVDSRQPLPSGHRSGCERPRTTPAKTTPGKALTKMAALYRAGRCRTRVLTRAAEDLAALVLESAALPLHTTAAVIWPVQTAAEVMTRAAHDSGGTGELGPRLPAGVPMVPVEHPRPGRHDGPAAPRRHLSPLPHPRPGPSTGLPAARESGG